jgi:hypothetical protein
VRENNQRVFEISHLHEELAEVIEDIDAIRIDIQCAEIMPLRIARLPGAMVPKGDCQQVAHGARSARDPIAARADTLSSGMAMSTVHLNRRPQRIPHATTSILARNGRQYINLGRNRFSHPFSQRHMVPG